MKLFALIFTVLLFAFIIPVRTESPRPVNECEQDSDCERGFKCCVTHGEHKSCARVCR